MRRTFWLYSHNFTHSGAPLVLASIARELAEAGWRERLRVLSWGGVHDRRHSTLQNELQAEGIHCEILDLDQPAPRPHKEDRLLLNSLALPETVIRDALLWVQQGRLQRLDWYCHEANPEALLQGQGLKSDVLNALHSLKLKMRVPSLATLQVYQEWLNYYGPSLSVQVPKVVVPTQMLGTTNADFTALRLQLVGAIGAGEKGHLWLLELIDHVLSSGSPDPRLRSIYLTFIGVESGAYAALAVSLCKRAEDLLGDRFDCIGQSNRFETLQSMAKSNLAVSCSMRETFSLAAAEAMALGQPLLRTRTGGFVEQLVDMGTGFDLGCPGFPVSQEAVDVLQRLRDPALVTEDQLRKMGGNASRHAQGFMDTQYSDWLLDE